MSEIDAIIENGEFKNFDKMTNDLLLNSDPHIIIAALLKNAYDHELDESNYSEISVSSDRRDSTRGDRNPRDSRDSREPREPRERRARDTDRVPEEDSLDTTGKVRLFIAIGKKDGITLKKLLDKISKKANVAESKIRNVELYENFSFVSVPFKEAEIIIDAFEVERTGKKPLIEKAKENKKR